MWYEEERFPSWVRKLRCARTQTSPRRFTKSVGRKYINRLAIPPTHFILQEKSIILGLNPFYAVEDATITEFSKFGTMSYKTLMKYFDLLTFRVEKKIAAELPDKFCLVFDGWTSSKTHYIGIFATFPADTELKYKKVLLGFTPLLDETNQTAENHCELIEFVLNVFGKSTSNIIALCGDNCNTNKAIANKLEVGFVGCASHRFNLFVKNIIISEDVLIESIREIMKKVSHPVTAAKLRKFSDLRPVCSNATRWSSTANMLKRFLELREAITNIEEDEIDVLMPSTRNVRKVENLCETFGALDSVTKALQDDSIDLADVRGIFDSVIETYPDANEFIGPDAGIVHQPHFESGIVKVLDNQSSKMNSDELTVTQCLLHTPSVDHESDTPSTELTFTQRALKKRKQCKSQDVAYINARFILPTSNICERFFSVAGYALNDRRMSMDPTNFEQQMFLYANSEYWDIEDVNSIINDNN